VRVGGRELRALAARLIAEPCVRRVEFSSADDELVVFTADAPRLFDVLNAWGAEHGSIERLSSRDESLEAVFGYLAHAGA
jgi:hypothetical protein